MDENKAVFEVYALVELFGHQRLAGAGFIRVDVPQTSRRAGFTRFFGPSAIYGITPVDEAVAKALAESIYVPEIVPFTASMRQLTQEDDDNYEN
jgi:hypothetical protein